MKMRYILSALLVITSCYAGLFDSVEEILYQEHAAWVYLLASFLAGIGVSFTPCIYPMIPITAGLLHRQAGTGFMHSLLASLSYVFGLSSVYAFLGFIVANTTLFFGSWHSSSLFTLPVALLMFYLGFATIGWYDLYLPRALVKQVEIKGLKHWHYVYLFFMGAVSGTIASPCVSPALAALLAFVAQAENPVLGYSMLFLFGLGMSSILLLVGVFASAAHKLPRAGAWMNEFKNFMGYAIIAVGVNFLMPFINREYELAAFGVVVLLAAATYIGQAVKGGVQRHVVRLIFGLLLLVIALLMITNNYFNWHLFSRNK